MSRTITVSVDTATKLSTSVFSSMGMSDVDATATTWPLIEGEMMGIPTHGLIRVPSYARRFRLGGIDPKASRRLDWRRFHRRQT